MAAAAFNHLGSPLSMVETTAKRILPVVKQVLCSLVPDKNSETPLPGPAIDMRTVLGYLNQTEWINGINIGNLMQITPFQMSDILDIQ